MRRPSLTFVAFVMTTFLIYLINQSWMIFNAKSKQTFPENLNIQRENNEAELSFPGQESAAKSTKGKLWNLLMSLTNLEQHKAIARKFSVCLSSICKHTSLILQLHIVTDKSSKSRVNEVIEELKENLCKGKIIVIYHNIPQLSRVLLPYMEVLQAIFTSRSHSYYSGALFFLSIVSHILFPNISKLIILDADLKFHADIKRLFFKFEKFSPANIIGIAHEQQPTYRHITWEYRRDHPGTIIGDPPPDGFPGFNSGVVLLDLHRMRHSPLYRQYIENTSLIIKLSETYHFKGHLGDQGFYTLLSFQHPELFYALPCVWNRQLCVWWRDNGYKNIFDLYHNCSGPVYVYHGNCNTPIHDSGD